MIAENVRDEQRKVIKYNHLVANLLSFRTLSNDDQALQQLLEEGHTLDGKQAALSLLKLTPSSLPVLLNQFKTNFQKSLCF